ncbi:MAG: hypothetical protein AMXMBFR13_27940 [Phycisphaerae bacterium]
MAKNRPIVQARTGEAQRFLESEREASYRIVVFSDLIAPHPLVAVTRDLLTNRPTDRSGCIPPLPEGCLDVYVAPESLDRALRVMDALVKALDARNLPVWNAHPEPSPRRKEIIRPMTVVRVLGETLRISLDELSVKAPADPCLPTHYSTFLPTGKLQLRIHHPLANHKGINDRDGRAIEGRLNRFIEKLYVTAEASINRRENAEAYRQKQDLRRKELRQRQEDLAKAEQKLRDLDSQAIRWETHVRRREFLRELSLSAERRWGDSQPAAVREYLAWAKASLDRGNPVEAWLEHLAGSGYTKRPPRDEFPSPPPNPVDSSPDKKPVRRIVNQSVFGLPKDA